MKQVMSPAFRLEASHHRLVAACEQCTHFVADAVERRADGTTSPGACGLLFPTGPHRRAAWDALVDDDPLPFCKMFEPDRGDAVGDAAVDAAVVGAAAVGVAAPHAPDDADRPAGRVGATTFDTTGDPVALTAATRQTR
jgi:hypothetical protein